MLLNNKKKEKAKTEKPKKVKDSSFAKTPVLQKLRLIVGSIFAFSTLSFILVMANVWIAGGFFVLISYLLVIVLVVKLFTIKQL